MGWKGLIRDTIMLAVGVALLFNWVEKLHAAAILIITALAFSIYAWWRFFKG